MPIPFCGGTLSALVETCVVFTGTLAPFCIPVESAIFVGSTAAVAVTICGPEEDVAAICEMVGRYSCKS